MAFEQDIKNLSLAASEASVMGQVFRRMQRDDAALGQFVLTRMLHPDAKLRATAADVATCAQRTKTSAHQTRLFDLMQRKGEDDGTRTQGVEAILRKRVQRAQVAKLKAKS